MQAKMFQRYQWGRLLVILGSEAQALAVSWQVYQLTHSALGLGFTGLWLLLPGLLFFPLSGLVADLYDHKSVILGAYAAQALFTVALLWISFHPTRGVASIYAVLFGIGIGRCFSGPASSALLPMLIPERDLAKGITWGATVFQVANAGGPIIGGLLFTNVCILPPRWIGAPIVYCFSLASICVFLCVVATIRVEESCATKLSGDRTGVLAGLHFVLQSKGLLGSIVLDLFSVLFGGAVALMPIFAADILHLGAAGLGLLRATPGLGALAASLILILRPGKHVSGIRLLPWAATFSVATVAFAYSRWNWLSLLALFVIGFSQMMNLVGRSSIVQLTTPPEIRGRVSAISWILLGTSNELGGFESGLTAHWLGAVRAVAVGGFVSLCATGVAALVLPGFRQSSGTVKTLEAGFQSSTTRKLLHCKLQLSDDSSAPE